MPVRIRFAMHGTRNHRVLHIVAINSRRARNARPIELLGVYDPRLPAPATPTGRDTAATMAGSTIGPLAYGSLNTNKGEALPGDYPPDQSDDVFPHTTATGDVSGEHGTSQSWKMKNNTKSFFSGPHAPAKTIHWSIDRIRYWLAVGALPSPPVARLLEAGGILADGHPVVARGVGVPHLKASLKSRLAPTTRLTPAKPCKRCGDPTHYANDCTLPRARVWKTNTDDFNETGQDEPRGPRERHEYQTGPRQGGPETYTRGASRRPQPSL